LQKYIFALNCGWWFNFIYNKCNLNIIFCYIIYSIFKLIKYTIIFNNG
jgi:hypothetical protein